MHDLWKVLILRYRYVFKKNYIYEEENIWWQQNFKKQNLTIYLLLIKTVTGTYNGTME